MPVKMIGSKAGEHGDFRTKLPGPQQFQLEAAEFKHHPVMLIDPGELWKQADADVSAEPCRETGGGEQMVNECCGGGLAVTSGDTNDASALMAEEQVNFGGDVSSAIACDLQAGE